MTIGGSGIAKAERVSAQLSSRARERAARDQRKARAAPPARKFWVPALARELGRDDNRGKRDRQGRARVNTAVIPSARTRGPGPSAKRAQHRLHESSGSRLSQESSAGMTIGGSGIAKAERVSTQLSSRGRGRATRDQRKARAAPPARKFWVPALARELGRDDNRGKRDRQGRAPVSTAVIPGGRTRGPGPSAKRAQHRSLGPGSRKRARPG